MSPCFSAEVYQGHENARHKKLEKDARDGACLIRAVTSEPRYRPRLCLSFHWPISRKSTEQTRKP